MSYLTILSTLFVHNFWEKTVNFPGTPKSAGWVGGWGPKVPSLNVYLRSVVISM